MDTGDFTASMVEDLKWCAWTTVYYYENQAEEHIEDMMKNQ